MEKMNLFETENLVSIREASAWASQHLNRKISISNISYLIQYGRIKKYGANGNPLINLDELKQYYKLSLDTEKKWKETLGTDLDWHLSFVEYTEAERTKHVHRLHPYKGKFIPQLVEYFLDSHTDEFKKNVYFHRNDIVLDPFCGSGTTLVQANELGIHAIGIDISSFNAMISNIKIGTHNFSELSTHLNLLSNKLKNFQSTRNILAFDEQLLAELTKFNVKNFPSPEFKRKVRLREINEKEYGKEKEDEFLKTYYELVKYFKINIEQQNKKNFLDEWFLLPVREELDFLLKEIKNIQDREIKKVLAIILSRTARSCRATTHADLGTLIQPTVTTYFCKKHGKICKPLFTIAGWWQRYTFDTLKRLKEFQKLKTDTYQICLTGDSRTIDIAEKIINTDFAKILMKQKIKGIFSSPPYVGLIDYHEQHAYAYELFGFKRNDELEIGPLFKGQGNDAKKSYISGIANVLTNCKNFLQNDYDVFLVANDKYQLYPDIAQLAGMKIVNQFKRPVLNRVEKDRSAYSETIFHLKDN